MKILIDDNIEPIQVKHAIEHLTTEYDQDDALYAEQLYAYAVDHGLTAIVTGSAAVYEALKNSGIHVYYLTLL